MVVPKTSISSIVSASWKSRIEPVSLRWLGAAYCGWLPSLHGMGRAGAIPEFREALRDWNVPTWSLVVADVDGNIGYQSVGRIPIRKTWERAYRPGWDPAHAWDGLIPYDSMPRLENPDRGWIASANNRTAPSDFPYPLAGAWSSGHRARRVRQMIEARELLHLDDIKEMHQDAMSLRAVDCLPGLQAALARSDDARVQRAAGLLEAWDCRMELDRVGATIFETFFAEWSRTVAEVRFPAEKAEFVAGAVGGLATRLLYENRAGWFQDDEEREEAILRAMIATLERLGDRFGEDMASWTWGNAHRIHLAHVLSGIGELGELLDRGGIPVRGNGVTVCNTGFDPNWGARMGANYRLIADMSTNPPGLWAVDAQGQSGHPGSPHYCDQLEEWISGRYHYLSLDRETASKTAVDTLTLAPE